MTIQQTSPGAAISLSGVTVEPVSGRIGAVISGLDISEPLDDATVELVQQALDTWKVVFFRGQELDHASQIAFGRRFGRADLRSSSRQRSPGWLPRDLYGR